MSRATDGECAPLIRYIRVFAVDVRTYSVRSLPYEVHASSEFILRGADVTPTSHWARRIRAAARCFAMRVTESMERNRASEGRRDGRTASDAATRLDINTSGDAPEMPM